MSGSRRSVGPVRQLSLQQPAPRRQQIRRQRSAEDDKSLQIYANPIARGRHGASVKSASERPKVRVAWSENLRKNEKQVEQVEVVARQIPGRSRPTTGKSRAYGVEKASILYSRQELAERLRLAWKHREENKANIDIFLAHGTLEERCDSELSSYTTITAPSTPLPRKDRSKLENFLINERKITQNHQTQKSTNNICVRGNSTEDEVSLKTDNDLCNLKNDKHEPSSDAEQFCVDVEQIEEINESGVPDNAEKNENGKIEVEKEEKFNTLNPDANEDSSDVKRRTAINIDCPNPHVQFTLLPSIKSEITAASAAKTSKDDFSSAKQKRASFQSATNRAFLGPIKSPTEVVCNAIADRTAIQKTTTDNKTNATIEKTAATRTLAESKDNPANDKTTPIKTVSEIRCNSASDEITFQKATTDTKSNLTIDKRARARTIENKDTFVDEKSVAGTLQKKTSEINVIIAKNVLATVENKNNLTDDRIPLARNISEIRCNSVTEKSTTSKKTPETPKFDQKSRRTHSAPPQRNLGNSANRLQVNIVIDTPGTLGSAGKTSVFNCQEKSAADPKDDVSDRIDTASPKISCGRSIRSAPLKRRTKSTKKRFWGAGSCRNDEEGKSRNRSSSRGKISIDSRAIDVVTMVSLVSSADSDSDAENSPGDDKLINELRSKLPTTPIIKTSMNSALSIARKPIKSVSFQKDSFDDDLPKEQHVPTKEEKKTIQPRFAIVNNRGNGGSLSSAEETVSWRTDIPGLVLPVVALIHDVEETLDVPLTDREKRCLAVPIGDLHDKKRKLLRTRSTPSRSGMERQTVPMETKEQESPGIHPRTEIPAHQTKTLPDNSPPKIEQISPTPAKETDQEIRLMPSEPHFQTSKEKECWHLYRKMCDKGVYVSFDTVLRGMLTPTEYRLRQKELSQDL